MKIVLCLLFIHYIKCQNEVTMMGTTYVDPDTNQQYDPNDNYYENNNDESNYNQYRSLLVNQYQQDQYDGNRQQFMSSLMGGSSKTESDKDPNVPQTYPFLGISYKITNPPYAPVTLVPYVEEDNTTKSKGTTVQSNVVITGKRELIV